MTRKDWLLLALGAANGEPLNPIQLQKILFLVGKRVPGGVGHRFYQFRPYNYGPFSAEVYRDVEELASGGLVRIDHSEPGRPWAVYSATPAGLAKAEELRAGASTEAFSYLDRLVAWARSLTFQQLVSAIYRDYPEQRANSVFVG